MGGVVSYEDLRTRASCLVDAVRGTVSVDGVDGRRHAPGRVRAVAGRGRGRPAERRRAGAVAGGCCRSAGWPSPRRPNGPGRQQREEVAALRRAIAEGELRLHYQPVMQLPGVEVAGVEALVRWQHPQRGLLVPEEFIPLAERSGLVVPLGEWVLRTACTQAATWRAAGAPSTSASTSRHGRWSRRRRGAGPRGAGRDRRAARRSGPRGHRERRSWTTRAHRPRCGRCRRWACGIALDDFGTGYSSLTYLKRFCVDAIKIDRSFVAGLGRDADDEAIVSSVVSLGPGDREARRRRGRRDPRAARGAARPGGGPGAGLPVVARPPRGAARPLDRHAPCGGAGRGPGSAEPRCWAARPLAATWPCRSRTRTVERIVALHGEGASLHTIAAALNAEGRRTPSGPRWTPTTVARVVASLARRR